MISRSNALVSSLLVLVLFACSAACARLLTPQQMMEQYITLEQAVPRTFDDWTQLDTGIIQMSMAVAEDGNLTDEQPYDQVVMRTYQNSRGERVMLALAYARQQKQEVKIHRPEICYTSQGYNARDERVADMSLFGITPAIPGKRLLMSNGERIEAVSYWIRVGEEYPRGGLNTRLTILKYGLQDKVPDAILVRASSILADESEASNGFRIQERFLAQLVRAMPKASASMLVASGR